MEPSQSNTNKLLKEVAKNYYTMINIKISSKNLLSFLSGSDHSLINIFTYFLYNIKGFMKCFSFQISSISLDCSLHQPGSKFPLHFAFPVENSCRFFSCHNIKLYPRAPPLSRRKTVSQILLSGFWCGLHFLV